MRAVDEIRTARLVLRPVTWSALTAVANADVQPDWAVGYPTAGDVEIAALLAQADPAYTEDQLGFLHRQIVERASGQVIGGIGFHSLPHDGLVEVGYGIAAPSRRGGYATEALAALLADAWSHPDIRLVVAGTDVGNVASQRVLARAGFHHLGRDGDQLRFGARRPGS